MNLTILFPNKIKNYKKDTKFEKYLTKKISVKQKSLRVTKNWDL